MAQPIAFEVPAKPAPGYTEHLRNAPEEHAEALLSAYALLQSLHDRGVLSLLRGMVDSGDALAASFTAAANTPESIRGIRNFLLLTKLFGSIPPEVLTRLVEVASSAAQSKKQPKPPGLLRLLWRLRREDSRRAASVAMDLLEGVGGSAGDH